MKTGDDVQLKPTCISIERQKHGRHHQGGGEGGRVPLALEIRGTRPALFQFGKQYYLRKLPTFNQIVEKHNFENTITALRELK